MADESAKNMFEEAKEKLLALLKQESELRGQIQKWAPLVQQLAVIAGVELDPELAKRITDEMQPGQDMGLTEAVRWVFKENPKDVPLSPTQVRDRMGEMGYDLSRYAFVMPPIHNTLKRMRDAGELEEVEWQGKRAYKAADLRGLRDLAWIMRSAIPRL